MTPRVLITGATGFVGRQILAACVARKVNMRLVVRAGWQDKLGDLPDTCEIVEVEDLFAQSADWWAATLTGIDTLIHSAWYTEPGKYLTSPKNTECLIGTLQMARGAVQAGLRRFVGVGTCIEYQLGPKILTPATALAPSTPYGQAKAAAFHALSGLFGETKTEFLWCRLFQPYGEGEHAQRLYPYLHSRLSAGKTVTLGSGREVRDFIDVKTAGANIFDAARGKDVGAINICTGIPKSVREFATEVAQIYGRPDLLKFGALESSASDWDHIVGQPYQPDVPDS